MNKIIIAEDDVIVRNAYLNYFERFAPGAKVDVVPDGRSLVEKVKEGCYSLCITDNLMPPGITGIEAIKEIRKSDSQLQIYMVAGGDFRQQAMDAGANGYFEKGADGILKDIVDIIKRHQKQ